MAGRPRKNTVEVKENKDVESVKTTKKETKDSTDSLKIENDELKSQIAELRKQLEDMLMLQQDMMKQNQEKENSEPIEVNEVDEEYVEISPMKPIKVVSLFNGGVNLSTGGDSSSAKYFRFDKFGATKVLTYQDLQDVITNNRSFIEDGYVYICDKNVVRNNYLEDFYKRFLTVDTINNILTFSDDKIREMVSNTTTAIQETIISILVDKINRGEYVNRNKVAIVGESVKDPCDIFNLALQMSAK